MDNRYKNLLDDEIRRLLKLINQFHTLPLGSEERRRWLLEGICGLIGADAGEFALIEPSASPPYRLVASIQVATDRHNPRRLISHPPGRRHVNDPAIQRLMDLLNSRRGKTQMLTHTRLELLPGASTPSSDFDDAIYSAKLLSPLPLIAIFCLARRRKTVPRRLFGPRECHIVRLFHSEAKWAYVPSTPARLTPRQQECLQCLLTGHSEKQIAINMNLSPHTVHVHVKAVYRGLRVSTRPELMAHFMPQP